MEIKKSRNYDVKCSKGRLYNGVPQEWDVIVDHITEGLLPGTLNWLTNIEKNEKGNYVASVSCHYLVTKTGIIYQLVSLGNGAWGALKKSPSAEIIKSRTAPPNLFVTHIEHEGVHTSGKGELTKAQYAASLWLHKHIIEEYEAAFKKDFPVDRKHIIGHYEVDTINRDKTDPGYNFQWEELLADLTAWDKDRKTVKAVIQQPKNDRLNGPYISPEGEKLYFRVVGKSCATREEAESIKKRLISAGFPEAWFYAELVKK